jgi:RecB family endonuclease NucS
MLNSPKKSKVYATPTLKKAAAAIKECLEKRKILLIAGNCWVDYRGRASSKLDAGERIVIIKEDGSVLVHRPSGYEPVNWQPPGCLFQTNAVKDVLLLRAVRRKPRESVGIFFDRIYLLSVLSLVDRGEFSLYASEEEMQRAILIKPEIIEAGFKPISYEKKVEPGFVDVYGTDKNGNFVVVEIKRKTAGRKAVLQLAKYVESIRGKVNRDVRGILAAPRTAKGVQRLLATLKLDFKPLDPKECTYILGRPETRKISDFLQSE